MHLLFADLAVDNLAQPSMLRIHLKVSKTDTFGRGVDMVIGKTTNNLLCPIRAMLDNLLASGSGQGPLFRFRIGKPLSYLSTVCGQNSAGTFGGRSG